MKRFRFSLAGLMAAVLIVAVACAALRFASELWASATLTITVGVLLTAILGVVLREGRIRAFWLGFSVFGWAYLALAFGWFSTNFTQHLLTTKLLAYAHPKLLQPMVQQDDIQGLSVHRVHLHSGGVHAGKLLSNCAACHTSNVLSLSFSPGGKLLATEATDKTVKIWDTTTGSLVPAAVPALPSWEHFQQVGHSLFALLMALLGGLLARHLFARPRDQDESAPSS